MDPEGTALCMVVGGVGVKCGGEEGDSACSERNELKKGRYYRWRSEEELRV